MQTVTRERNISKLFTETRNELGLSEKGERREREERREILRVKDSQREREREKGETSSERQMDRDIMIEEEKGHNNGETYKDNRGRIEIDKWTE